MVEKVEEPAVDARAVEVVDRVEEPGVDARSKSAARKDKKTGSPVKVETPVPEKATRGAKKAESPVEAEKPAEAEKPTRGGRRKAPGGSGGGGMFEMSVPRPAEEHLGRRGWMQCLSKEKRPRYSPGELTPDENVQEKHSFIKDAPNGAYLLKSGSKMFKRNIRFIKAAPNAQDTDPPNITQAVKGENECRPKVQGSNPTDGPMTRSRSKKDRRQRHH